MGRRLLRRRGLDLPRQASDARGLLRTRSRCPPVGRNRGRAGATTAAEGRRSRNDLWIAQIEATMETVPTVARLHATKGLPRTSHALAFIGNAKRAQARNALQVVLAQPDLVRGNPAFGIAGARYCLRGHDKWNARIRPFKGRGTNEEDPLNQLRQCLACVREDARAKRNKN